MPSSKQRHRVEIDAALYARLNDLATREGYPVARFMDRMLHWAEPKYVAERRQGRYPFAEPADSAERTHLTHEDEDISQSIVDDHFGRGREP